MSSNKSDSASSTPLGGAVASGSDEAEGPICQLCSVLWTLSLFATAAVMANQPIVPPWSSQAVLKLEHKNSQIPNVLMESPEEMEEVLADLRRNSEARAKTMARVPVPAPHYTIFEAAGLDPTIAANLAAYGSPWGGAQRQVREVGRSFKGERYGRRKQMPWFASEADDDEGHLFF